MKWLDVAGPPGVGKSTLCDPIFGPRDIPLSDTLPPPEWHDFFNEVTRLLMLVQDHPSYVAAVRMNRRTMRKMAAVHYLGASASKPVYIQTGFVQRGLGFGWRLADLGMPVSELYHFFRLMPVSLGVVFLEADQDEIRRRNREREDVAETAHENRSFMVPLMQPAIDYAKEILGDRGVEVSEITTTGDPDAARKLLQGLAADAGHTETLGLGSKVPPVSPPVWW